MTRMPDIYHQAEEAVYGPCAPQGGNLNVLAGNVRELAAIIAELGATPLIRQLHEHGLGRLLQPDEVDTVLRFVAGLEYPRQRTAIPDADHVPEMTP